MRRHMNFNGEHAEQALEVSLHCLLRHGEQALDVFLTCLLRHGEQHFLLNLPTSPSAIEFKNTSQLR